MRWHNSVCHHHWILSLMPAFSNCLQFSNRSRKKKNQQLLPLHFIKGLHKNTRRILLKRVNCGIGEIFMRVLSQEFRVRSRESGFRSQCRSEEHTSELQSRLHLVCRLLLEKKKIKKKKI